MLRLLLYLSMASLLFLPGNNSHAYEKDAPETVAAKKKDELKARRKKALLSALLMINVNGSITVPDTDDYLATEGYTSYGLPFLRTHKMKKDSEVSLQQVQLLEPCACSVQRRRRTHQPCGPEDRKR